MKKADNARNFITTFEDTAKYALIKELEIKKYLSKDIVNIMLSKGYDWFNVEEMKKRVCSFKYVVV